MFTKKHFTVVRPKRAAWSLLFLYSLMSAALVYAQDKDWRPISPAELASVTSLVEPNADAEAIFWEVRIDDSSYTDVSRSHYVRVKILTERGQDKFSKFDVPFRKGIKIKDLAARVIKPDGTIVEIKKEDIFEREIVKAGGVKIKAKSFAVPNIAPGVIVEYRYKEAINNAGAAGMHLDFQRDIPVQKIAYYYKPVGGEDPKYQLYNFTDTKFVKDKGGFWLATRINVPALKDEPHMPPEDTVKPWVFLTDTRIGILSRSMTSIVYSIKDPTDRVRYWGAVAGEWAPIVKLMNKGGGDIKKTAALVTAGATTHDEKLRKIYEFCQTQISNTTFDTRLTDEEREKLPEVKSIEDALKRKAASGQYIDMLFGALASASGFETRVALMGDRSKMFFDPSMTNDRLLHPGAIAIKMPEGWKYFNPGVPFLPYGMLLWYEESNWAMLVGEEKFEWSKTPLTDHSVSSTARTGKFTLSDDGTLEGEIRIEMNGQPGITYRLETFDEAPAKRDQDLIASIKRQTSTAEVTGVSIENLSDMSKPVVQTYKVRVPNYAQKTGKRLFVQPGFFKYGAGPMFSSSTRKYDIYFRYAWSEIDTVEIKLPAGFELDNADAPDNLADPQKIGSLTVRMQVDKVSNVLKYDRKFHFGGGGNVLFPAAAYTAVKQLFDAFDKSDAHTITLKQK